MAPKRQTLFLYFSTCIANLMTFSAIVSFTWSATSIPRLNGSKEPENNPLEKPIGFQEESLIASLYFVGAMLGPLMAGFVAVKFGRKVTIVLFTVPTLISFLMTAFGTTVEVLYVGRFFGGISGGTVLTIIPLYTAEISEPHNRGILGAFIGLFSTLGNLYGYSVGAYTSIETFSLTGLVFPVILFAVMFFFIPETPYYWISRGKEDEAVKSLRQLRTGDQKSIDLEIEVIKRTIEQSDRDRGRFMDIFKSKASRRSLLITLVGGGIQQFSGIFAIQLYMHQIFAEAGSNLEPEVCSIILGAVRVAAYVIAVLAVDRYGRRFLLMESSIGTCISLTAIGIFFYLKTLGYDVEAITWLPLVGLICFDLSYNTGIGCVPVIQISELFPEHLKGIASIIVITFCSVLSFIITLIFPYMEAEIGMGPSFWVFASSGLIGAIFTYFVVPETKGKTLYDIQIMLNK